MSVRRMMAERASPPESRATLTVEAVCADCAFHSGALAVPDVAVALSSLPGWWAHLFSSADEQELHRHTSTDQWSVVERGGHVRDTLHVKTNRLERLRDGDRPVIDEVVFAVPRAGDNDREAEVVLVGLRQNAIRIVKVVLAMGEEGWSHTGRRGEQIVDALDLTREAVHDGVHHLRAARLQLVGMGGAPASDSVDEDIWGTRALACRQG